MINIHQYYSNIGWFSCLFRSLSNVYLCVCTAYLISISGLCMNKNSCCDLLLALVIWIIEINQIQYTNDATKSMLLIWIFYYNMIQINQPNNFKIYGTCRKMHTQDRTPDSKLLSHCTTNTHCPVSLCLYCWATMPSHSALHRWQDCSNSSPLRRSKQQQRLQCSWTKLGILGNRMQLVRQNGTLLTLQQWLAVAPATTTT